MSGDGLRVFPVTYSQTKPFLLSVHYARRMPNIRYAFGLFDGWDLIGVCTFGSPASPPLCKGLAGEENHKHVLELNRLAFLPGKNGMNHASILVGRSLRMLPHGTFVVSFADWGGWHHVGYVYQATNWLYTGLTKARTDLAGVGGGTPVITPKARQEGCRGRRSTAMSSSWGASGRGNGCGRNSGTRCFRIRKGSLSATTRQTRRVSWTQNRSSEEVKG